MCPGSYNTSWVTATSPMKNVLRLVDDVPKAECGECDLRLLRSISQHLTGCKVLPEKQ